MKLPGFVQHQTTRQTIGFVHTVQRRPVGRQGIEIQAFGKGDIRHGQSSRLASSCHSEWRKPSKSG